MRMKSVQGMHIERRSMSRVVIGSRCCHQLGMPLLGLTTGSAGGLGGKADGQRPARPCAKHDRNVAPAGRGAVLDVREPHTHTRTHATVRSWRTGTCAKGNCKAVWLAGEQAGVPAGPNRRPTAAPHLPATTAQPPNAPTARPPLGYV